MPQGHIVLVGTSHIAKQSVRAVDAAIAEHKPAIIAIELDQGRLAGLMNPTRERPRLRDIRHVGLTGFFFSILGAWAERMLGERVGTKPGADMLHAVRLAQQHNIPLALIDRDIRITLKRLSSGLTWRERGRFVVDVVRALLGGKGKLPFDLNTVPDDAVIEMLLRDVRVRYPNAYRVLVKERNDHMARQLRHIAGSVDGTIIAVLGAGHIRDVQALLKQ